jgi:hypothetical protein
VRSEVVHDDDISGLEFRDEELIDIGLKRQAIDRSVENHGRCHSRQSERGDESRRFPMAMGHTHAQPLAARRPPVPARHVGGGPSLVDKDEALRVEIELSLEPVLAPLHDVRSILLAGVRGLFLRVILWRSRNRQSAP